MCTRGLWRSSTASSSAPISAFACPCASPSPCQPGGGPMRLDTAASAGLLRTVPVALALLCACGCANFQAIHTPPPAQHNESAAEDRDTVAAVFMAGMFQSMQHLAQAGPAEQAEIVASAREAYDRAPQQGSAKLRYALLLATPGHPARNPALAQKLLRELA